MLMKRSVVLADAMRLAQNSVRRAWRKLPGCADVHWVSGERRSLPM